MARTHRIWPAALLLTLAACSERGPTDPGGGDPGPAAPGYPTLEWPMPGIDGRDWTINNYVDLDSGSGLLDYRGGTKVYDGHRGVDIDVPTFRSMDAGFPILAAAAGEVTSVHDGEFDRNTSCTGDWNQVTVTHANGSRAIYGHLRNGSVSVTLGQNVESGDTLGIVGSSGCSTQPHLHFELLSPGNAVVDPFSEGLWAAPPAYDTPLTFMDVIVKDGPITGVDEMKDPSPNVDSVAAGGGIGIGVSMAGGGPGDVVGAVVRDGAGTQVLDLSVVFDRIWRHTYWYWNRTASGTVGSWTIDIQINGVTVESYGVTVY